MPTHQMAVIRKESWVACAVDMPKGQVKIRAIPAINGKQLPI